VPHIEVKMALRAAVLRRRLSRATYVVEYDYLFIFMGLLTTFLQKQHKNSNISIKILTTYIF